MSSKLVAIMESGGDVRVELTSITFGSRSYLTYTTKRGRVLATPACDGLRPIDARRNIDGCVFIVNRSLLGTTPESLGQQVRRVERVDA